MVRFFREVIFARVYGAFRSKQLFVVHGNNNSPSNSSHGALFSEGDFRSLRMFLVLANDIPPTPFSDAALFSCAISAMEMNKSCALSWPKLTLAISPLLLCRDRNTGHVVCLRSLTLQLVFRTTTVLLQLFTSVVSPRGSRCATGATLLLRPH